MQVCEVSSDADAHKRSRALREKWRLVKQLLAEISTLDSEPFSIMATTYGEHLDNQAIKAVVWIFKFLYTLHPIALRLLHLMALSGQETFSPYTTGTSCSTWDMTLTMYNFHFSLNWEKANISFPEQSARQVAL